MTDKPLLDEMYPARLAEWLGEHGHDVRAVVHTPELVGVDDATVLDAATAGGRCLVTENVRDFAVLVRHMRHAGVLFVNAKRWPRTRNGIGPLVNALDKTIANGQIPGADEVAWLS